jgi:hypothetical protein
MDFFYTHDNAVCAAAAAAACLARGCEVKKINEIKMKL